MFHNNPNVAFGDVNLSKQPIRGPYNPGAGGWPTVRYFNKATGYEGAPYKKKTQKSMCDELGSEDYMRAYIEEYGGTSLCSVETKVGCSDKESEFIDKWTASTSDQLSAEVQRLETIKETKASPESLKWIQQRLSLLRALSSRHVVSSETLKQEL
eukprot:c9239_g1_i3.p1 GENE.c9239_g1_i3~~c9239_g1_i3.p1  ORF type:complete len:155 (+),score=31.11 c9239_g1_i3:255-719(+)